MARQAADRSIPTRFLAGIGRQDSPSSLSRRAEGDGTVPMRVLELLTARLCHELSAPIAAINNGIELLAEEQPGSTSGPGTGFRRDAAALLAESAQRAAARLQFYRFAYGFSRGSVIAGRQPHELAAGIFAASQIVCDYPENVRGLPLDWQKLACNLLSVGVETLPRGGRLILGADPLQLEAVGEAADLSGDRHAALMWKLSAGELTSRTVQSFFPRCLRRRSVAKSSLTRGPGGFA